MALIELVVEKWTTLEAMYADKTTIIYTIEIFKTPFSSNQREQDLIDYLQG